MNNSLQSSHNFLSDVAYRQTNKQTNGRENITSFAKEITNATENIIYLPEQININIS